MEEGRTKGGMEGEKEGREWFGRENGGMDLREGRWKERGGKDGKRREGGREGGSDGKKKGGREGERKREACCCLHED